MAREFTVKIDSNVGLMVDKESTRYALSGVLVKHRVAVATNGRAIVATPCDAFYDDDQSEVVEPVIVNGDACAKAVRHLKNKTIRNPIKVNGRTECDGKIYDNPEGRYPNWRQVCEEIKPDVNIMSLSVDTKLLAKLAEAMASASSDDGSRIVTLTFEAPTEASFNTVCKPMHVTCDGSESIGIIMPCGRDTRDSARDHASKFNRRLANMKYVECESDAVAK